MNMALCGELYYLTSVGVSGEVIMDDVADRIPNYWLWQIQPGDQQFSYFATLRMISEEGDVRILLFHFILGLMPYYLRQRGYVFAWVVCEFVCLYICEQDNSKLMDGF